MAEEMLYVSEARRRFARIEPGDDRIPDESTALDFRRLPERHGSGKNSRTTRANPS